MEGCKDPFNRGCFPWGKEDLRFTDLFRGLAALKNRTPALQRGTVRVLRAERGVFDFARETEGQTVLCYVNHSDEPLRIPAGKLLYAMDAAAENGTVTLLPGGCACAEV